MTRGPVHQSITSIILWSVPATGRPGPRARACGPQVVAETSGLVQPRPNYGLYSLRVPAPPYAAILLCDQIILNRDVTPFANAMSRPWPFSVYMVFVWYDKEKLVFLNNVDHKAKLLVWGYAGLHIWNWQFLINQNGAWQQLTKLLITHCNEPWVISARYFEDFVSENMTND